MFGMIPAGLLPMLQMPNGKNVGVMANDVAKMRPDALGPKVDGLQTVNYQQLDAPKSGGMFGGADWKSAIAAAIAGFSAGGGNPAGQMALQQLHGNRMQKQRQQLEEQQYQRQRSDGMQDWMAKQEYERQNPSPVNNDTANDYSFYEQKLGKAAADEWLKSDGDPIVTVQLPGNRVYSGPRSQLAAALGAPAAKPQKGHVEDGFELIGDDPGNPNSWRPVGQGGPAAFPPATFPRSR